MRALPGRKESARFCKLTAARRQSEDRDAIWKGAGQFNKDIDCTMYL